ncbi:MAG TPA: GNAT family N-acetyltransferase [Armatimonadota bacterium]|nr:GNAT family N-acetyltransferase [Armatimonadota bacterium]
MTEHASNQPACPERIEHPLFVLRCRDEADAPRFREVIDRNLDHLRRFMPWAWNEPRPVEELAERISAAREKFARGEEWQFGIFSPDEARVLGAIGLHRGDAPATMEIGFWLCRSAEGQGIVTEATRILTNLALTRLGAERVEIRCDTLNERSSAVARRLGYELADTRDEVYEGTPRRAETWVRTHPV